MDVLGIMPEELEVICISHDHGDHTGGLQGLLADTESPVVYAPGPCAARLKHIVEAAEARVVGVREPVEILPGVRATGALGESVVEEALVVDAPVGLLVITGCAHPGIVRILERARTLFEGRSSIHLVMGGFHLGSTTETDIKDIVSAFRRLGVEKVAPTHCSGDMARELFSAEYGPNCLLAGVGWQMTI